MESCKVRVQSLRPLKHGERLFVPTEVHKAEANVHLNLRAVRTEVRHGQVLAQRIPEIPAFEEQQAEAIHRIRIVRVGLDGPPEVFGRFLEVPQFGVSRAQVAMKRARDRHFRV